MSRKYKPIKSGRPIPEIETRLNKISQQGDRCSYELAK